MHHEKSERHHTELMKRAQRWPHGDGFARRISTRDAQRKAENSQAAQNKPHSCLWLTVIDGLGVDRQPRTLILPHASRTFGRPNHLQGMAIAHLRHGRHEDGHDLRGVCRQKAHGKSANRA